MIDKLKIINDLKKLIPYVNKIIKNYPKTETVLRDRILDSCYSCLEYAYLTNENKDYEIREKYQRNILVKLKMIDFYFKCSYKEGYIEGKRYTKISNHLRIIIKETYGWIKSDEWNKGKKQELINNNPKYKINAKERIERIKEEEEKTNEEIKESI